MKFYLSTFFPLDQKYNLKEGLQNILPISKLGEKKSQKRLQKLDPCRNKMGKYISPILVIKLFSVETVVSQH